MLRTLLFALFLIASHRVTAAPEWLEKIGKTFDSKSSWNSLAGISQDQMVNGLKEALSKGIQTAVTNLGRNGGFLDDAKVRIPLPESLAKIEKGLRAIGQNSLADDFVLTMNRAAEQAAPEAAAVLGESVKQMNIADAKGILTATNSAATEYFRKTASTNLYNRFKPIVQKATENTGATGAYKKMTEKLGPSGFGKFGSLVGSSESLDVDDYVTRKALDGLFLKIAEQEKMIRDNPAARSTELLQKVFGSIKK